MVETGAWASECCLASAEHPKRLVRRVVAAPGEARTWEALAVVAKPAEGHLVAWETLEVLLGEMVLPAAVLGVGRTTEGVSAQKLPGPGRSVEVVVADQRCLAQHLGPELVVAWADRWFHWFDGQPVAHRRPAQQLSDDLVTRLV